jgi:hypothetical protein
MKPKSSQKGKRMSKSRGGEIACLRPAKRGPELKLVLGGFVQVNFEAATSLHLKGGLVRLQ